MRSNKDAKDDDNNTMLMTKRHKEITSTATWTRITTVTMASRTVTTITLTTITRAVKSVVEEV